MKSSFVALQESDAVKADDLKDTLEDYAAKGFSIAPDVVIGLISRTDLSKADREELITSARKGEERQRSKHEYKASEEYSEVIRYLRGSLRFTL